MYSNIVHYFLYYIVIQISVLSVFQYIKLWMENLINTILPIYEIYIYSNLLNVIYTLLVTYIIN